MRTLRLRAAVGGPLDAAGSALKTPRKNLISESRSFRESGVFDTHAHDCRTYCRTWRVSVQFRVAFFSAISPSYKCGPCGFERPSGDHSMPQRALARLCENNLISESRSFGETVGVHRIRLSTFGSVDIFTVAILAQGTNSGDALCAALFFIPPVQTPAPCGIFVAIFLIAFFSWNTRHGAGTCENSPKTQVPGERGVFLAPIRCDQLGFSRS